MGQNHKKLCTGNIVLHQEKCEKERDTHIISNYVDSGKIILDVGVPQMLGSLGSWILLDIGGHLDKGVSQTLSSLESWSPFNVEL